MSRERAVVIGGFSESDDCIRPLTKAIESAITSKVEQFTWSEAFSQKEKLGRAATGATVFTHSAGALFLSRGLKANRAVALSGPEPTSPLFAVIRAGRVALSGRRGREEEAMVSVLDSVEEILRHPNHLRILGHVGMFSTAERLILAGNEGFPGGRFYLPSRGDEFGFGRQQDINRAAAHGVTAMYIGRGHNYALQKPRATVDEISKLLDAPPVAA